MKAAILLPLAAVLAAVSPNLQAQQTITGSGGTLYAGTAVGQNIAGYNITTSDGRLASFTCPITQFGIGTQAKWKCAGGQLLINNVKVADVSGSMTYQCSGGGRDSTTRCTYSFKGTVTVVAKGRTNFAPGSITYFSATY